MGREREGGGKERERETSSLKSRERNVVVKNKKIMEKYGREVLCVCVRERENERERERDKGKMNKKNERVVYAVKLLLSMVFR